MEKPLLTMRTNRAVTLITTLITSVLVMVCHTSHAATFKPENTETWFQVEVVIFAQEAGLSTTSEQWPDKIDITYPENLQVLKQPQLPTVLQNKPEPTGSFVAEDAMVFDIEPSLDEEPATSNDTPSAEPPTAHNFSQFDPMPSAGIESTQAEQTLSPMLTEITIASLPQKLAEPTDLRKTSFMFLPESKFQLNGIKQRIDRALDMRLLAHFAWRQPVKSELAQPVLVQVGKQYGLSFELEGVVTLSKNRYLHFDSNLFYSTFKQGLMHDRMNWGIFSENQAATDAINAEHFSAEREQSFDLFRPVDTGFERELTANYKSMRRIKENEIHYLDHPLFGVLFIVSPYQLPDPVLEMPDFDLDALPLRKPLPKVSELPLTTTLGR